MGWTASCCEGIYRSVIQMHWWGSAGYEEWGKTDCEVEPKQQGELHMVDISADNSQLSCKDLCNQNAPHLSLTPYVP